ncbi:MurR/RpiR family transcriptional regulator [uncultured Sphaerochaeta sp.]|uniref:MurR/RpiR family transcriptional regulator n=1 Tax=uncultured Sphaerochaeta sp. TaxID=886478 RepID=UPI002A0A2F95|nr:MurR/RpiR family transcriptional regulator [uncultured Sphaerochaeta sp.]
MVREKIRETLSNMSPSFNHIAIYIIDNYDEIGFTSVNDLSKSIGVSNASLVRFTQFLGFKGYKEFREAAQAEVKNKLNKDSQVVLNELDVLPSTIQLQKLSENEIHNLSKTLKDINVQILSEMVQKAYASRRIFISGFGVSRNIMQIFEYALVSMQITDVVSITGSISDYNPRLHSLGKEDSLFVMTLPPYSLEAIHVANFAKKQGAEVFLFTDSPACPIYSIATAVVRCENNSLLLTNSYVGMVAVIQVFINMLLINSKKNLLKSMKTVAEDEQRGYKFMKSLKDTI